MKTLLRAGLCCFYIGAGCGDSSGDAADGSGGAGGQCGKVPACHREAVEGLRACAESAELTLGAVRVSSGVVQGLSCASDTQEVTFSDFSERPNGTVPTPSSVVFLRDGTKCAELSFGKGQVTSQGATRTFQTFALQLPDLSPVTVRSYDDGDYQVTCGAREEQRDYPVTSASLEPCPEALKHAELERNADLTLLEMDLVDAAGERETLFTCR